MPNIAVALREAFPNLGAVDPLRLLGEGFNSIAVETADGIVFRIAKNSDTTERHSKEARLLPVLSDHVTVAIPEPKWHTKASSMLPFGAIGYGTLSGRPLSPGFPSSEQARRIASEIAKFLVDLHRFPTDRAIALGLPGPETRQAELEAMHRDVLVPLRDALTSDEYRKVTKWWDGFLADEWMQRYTPALTHCDLWYENILVDDEMTAVVGILDFENSTVGDPARDFSTSLHHRSEFNVLALVTEAYLEFGGALDEHHSYRVQRLWELRPFDGIQHCVRVHDFEELEDSIAKLRNGPILTTKSGAH